MGVNVHHGVHSSCTPRFSIWKEQQQQQQLRGSSSSSKRDMRGVDEDEDSDVVDDEDSGVADVDGGDTVSSGVLLVVADISCDAVSCVVLGNEDDEDVASIDVSCTSLDTDRRLFEELCTEEDDGVSSTGGGEEEVSFPASASGNGSGRFDSSGNVSESGLTLRS